ncbi:glycosyltransferase family 4 protein [uncultured Lamprocystis sp.]|uniref:glycosyltransferase family 4 protein n=1 Tax=uncultured Lamprocystis sp. TaxID=543132 RepID=UPI0025EB3663|nr:glycosyltransferase family 4 protein [uncultured Lamprocystis sp.]
MRILILGDVPPGLIGGAQVQSLHLARRWAAAGHPVLIVGPANRPASDGHVSIVRLPVVRRLKILRAGSYLISATWFLWRRRYEYDLIYCRFLKEHALAASLARRLLRLKQPLVSCPANTGNQGDIYYVKHAPLPWLWRWAFSRGVSCINAMSARLAREVATLALAPIPVSRIPNGVVVPRQAPDLRRQDRPPRILCVGRFVAYKGHDVLLRAIRLLLDAGHAFELRLVGDGPLHLMLEADISRLGLSDVVSILGQRLPEQILDEIQQADLFVLPSLCEGMPGALLEALAHGLPAIATQVSGSVDILDDEIGWLVPVGDAEALASAIAAALDAGPDRLREMGSNARYKVAREYDMDVVAARYLTLFKELTDSSNAATEVNLREPVGRI